MADPTTITSGTAQLTMDGNVQELTGADLGPGVGQDATLIVQAGAVDIYVGFADDITTSTGHRIPSGGSMSVALGFRQRMWAVGAASTITVLRSVY